MMTKLLSPYEVKGITFKNRVVMSPMCMYAVTEHDGKVTDFHMTHYGSMALGQVGLVMLEATAVLPEGRISEKDLGIWSDEHIAGLTKLVQHVHGLGAKIGIQLNHAGRKADVKEAIFSATDEPFSDRYQAPNKMNLEQIKAVIEAFKKASERAEQAGFDVIEIHGAHGYLVNQFLSPLTNNREDIFGGPIGNRYRFLHDVIAAVQEVWSKPLFVRISAEDYAADGAHVEDYVMMGKWMRDQGVDLIDVSTGGVVNVAPTDIFPGYQVAYAQAIREQVGIATGAVGLITNGEMAEEILRNKRADMVFIGRELLRQPTWVLHAAQSLNALDQVEVPAYYSRGWFKNI